MTVPKTAALPLGYTPAIATIILAAESNKATIVQINRFICNANFMKAITSVINPLCAL
jgi:hypothetical protein